MSDNKVAIINSVYKIGSTGRICFELQKYLQEHKFDCCTFYGRNNQSLPNSYYFGNKLDLFIHGARSRLTGKQGLYSKLRTKKLIKKLEDYNPNTYIIHNLHGYYINYKLLLTFLSKKNVKVILVLHDCWCFTGHCAHFSFNKCDKWKHGCKSCAFVDSYPKSILFSSSLYNYKLKNILFNNIKNLTIVCPSAWMSRLVKQSFLNNIRTIVINNGIDTDLFKKKNNTLFRKNNCLTSYKLILCVAYIFDKRKGIEDIIKLSKIIDDDYRIIVIGKTKENLGLYGNIVQLGRTNTVDELVDIYSSCDVFFNPTYEDTYPTVNLEALSCGLPVVAYDSCGASEMIQKPFIVRQGDIDTAWHLIKRIVNKDIVYNFDGTQSFSKDIMYSQYLSLIKNLIS